MKVTLTEPEFDKLVRLSQAVELVQAQSRLALADATAKLNRYYATLAAVHGLPMTSVTMGFHEATCELEVAETNGHGHPPT